MEAEGSSLITPLRYSLRILRDDRVDEDDALLIMLLLGAGHVCLATGTSCGPGGRGVASCRCHLGRFGSALIIKGLIAKGQPKNKLSCETRGRTAGGLP